MKYCGEEINLKKMYLEQLEDLRTDIIDERESYPEDSVAKKAISLDNLLIEVEGEIAGRKASKPLTNDLLNSIVEVFEDFLDEKGIKIPNEERDASGDDGCANIWGEDYDFLMDSVRDILRDSEIIVEDEWEN